MMCSSIDPSTSFLFGQCSQTHQPSGPSLELDSFLFHFALGPLPHPSTTGKRGQQPPSSPTISRLPSWLAPNVPAILTRQSTGKPPAGNHNCFVGDTNRGHATDLPQSYFPTAPRRVRPGIRRAHLAGPLRAADCVLPYRTFPSCAKKRAPFFPRQPPPPPRPPPRPPSTTNDAAPRSGYPKMCTPHAMLN